MRFLHTADWHLGRVLHGADLVDDQACLLDQFVELARQEKPDAVIVAGDVYDRAVPPPEAVCLLDDVLSRLVGDLKMHVIVVAGNHDSAQRLSFGSRLFASGGLHIVGQPDVKSQPIVLDDEAGPVHIYPVPFAEPAVVRQLTGQQELHSHEAAMKFLLDSIRAQLPSGARSVVVSHCFVNGLSPCESERPISIGGAGMIDAGLFDNFDYVALGHLHRPQACRDERVRYSGSLMRYSFSEVDHDKAVLLVEMDSAGRCEVRERHLTPRRQVRCIEGELEQLLAGADADPAREDYLLVRLMDKSLIFDAMGKLRERYPNVLHIERPVLLGQSSSQMEKLDHRQMDDLVLFGTFFKQVTGEELTEEQSVAFRPLVEQLRARQREAAT